MQRVRGDIGVEVMIECSLGATKCGAKRVESSQSLGAFSRARRTLLEIKAPSRMNIPAEFALMYVIRNIVLYIVQIQEE